MTDQAEGLRQAMREAGVQTPEYRPDQADELRKLANYPGRLSFRDTEGNPVNVDEILARGRAPIEGAIDELASPKPDKAKLWDDLSADLERWVRVGGFDKPNLSMESLAEFWEMMQRRKEQA